MKKITNSLLVWPIILLWACGGQKEEPVLPNPQQVIQAATEVVGIGKIMPVDGILELSSLTSGQVLSIPVKEGDTVEKGAILLTLDAKEEQVDLAENIAKLNTQKAKSASDAFLIKSEEIKLKDLQNKYLTSKKLQSEGAETLEVLNSDYTAFVQQQQELAKSKQQLQINRKLEQELQGSIKKAQLSTHDRTIRASKTGVVLSLSAKIGQLLPSNVAFGEFAALGNPVIECEVDELYANRVKLGNKVNIYAMGDTTILATGLVDQLATSLQNKSILYDNVGEGSDRRVRRLTIKLTQSHKNLLINDKVECKILLK